MDKYILCDNDNIILEHEDDTNNFTISFNVKENFNEIKELFIENTFFYLLKELNDDIINEYKENILNDINNVVLKIQTPNEPIFKKLFDKYIFLNIKYNKYITNENIKLTGVKDISISNVYNKSDIHFDQFNMMIQPINTNSDSCTKCILEFSFVNNLDGVTNKFISLYIKKLIKKFKQYFDMLN